MKRGLVIEQVRRVLGENITARLVSTFVISRLDYCNAILAGLPQSTMAHLSVSRMQRSGWLKDSVLVIIS